MIRKLLDKKNIVIILCIATILLGVLLRVDRMLFVEENYAIPDLNRDLLVGYHIAHYKEFTLIGPDSTSGLPLYNSSLFFILTAFTGIIFGFTTLGISIGNLVYQVASVGLLFATTKNLFNTRAAIFASTMMLLFDIFIDQSKFFWQPHLMQVVFMGSLFMLSLGYAKKNMWYVYISIFLYAASLGTHYPSLLLLPIFGIAVWMLLFYRRDGLLSYLYTALFGVLSLVVVFSTALYYKFFVPHIDAIPDFARPDSSIGYFVSTAIYRTEYLVSYYLPKADTVFLQLLACAVFIAGCVWYIRTASSVREKYTFCILVAAVVCVLFGVTVTYFPYESFVAYPLRYYTAVYIPLTIILGVLVAELWSRKGTSYRVLSAGIFGILLFAGGSYFGNPPVRPHTGSEHALTQFLFNDKSSLSQINTAMVEAMEAHGITDQFDVVTFDGNDGFFLNERADDILWFPLEIMTGTKLVSLDEGSLRSYRPVGNTDYVLVRCREVTEERCMQLIETNLSGSYSNYETIVERLTSSPDPSYLLKL